MAPRVAITSLGATTAFGRGVGRFWRGLLRGESGIGPVSRFPTEKYASKNAAEADPGDWSGLVPPPGRAHRLAMDALGEVLSGNATILRGLRGAVVVGTTMGENEFLIDAIAGKACPKTTLEEASLFSISHAVSRFTGARGPSLTPSVACASGTVAIGIGVDLIKNGVADVVVAGGVDSLSEFVFAGFDSLRALSRTVARPFDVRRDGLVLGEGAAFVLLEELSSARRRGATPLAIVSGYGTAGDAHHMTRPSPDGQGLVRAVASALSEAGITQKEIGFISTHGTATVFNDRMEAAAFSSIFGSRLPGLPVNSIKGAVGHTLGAAGALEAVLSALVLSRGMIPPTAGFEIPDPACPLAVVAGQPILLPESVRSILSTSSAFAGTNAALVLEKV